MAAQHPHGIATIMQANALDLPIADASVDLIVTSPPYFALRSYTDGGEHYAGQLGSEATPAEFLDALIAATREMVRVLKPSGSIWVNLGDKYSQRVALRRSSHQDGLFPGRPGLAKDWKRDREAGLARMPRENVIDTASGQYVPEKSLMGLPWRYAIRCMDELGLILRAEVIWSKPNGLPESVTDRVRRSHEQWFHFTVAPRYYSAVDAIREPHAPGTAARYAAGYSADSTSAGKHRAQGSPDYSGVLTANPLGKLPGSVWTVPTEPLRVPESLGVDHFAAFPTEWPRRIIAGWSPRAVCDDCGFLLGSSYDSGLLGVRDGLRRSRPEREAGAVLLEGVRESAHLEEPRVDEVSASDDARLRRGLEPAAPDGTEVRVPDGAPAGHGRAPRPDAAAVRGGSPCQRGEDGQPDRESGTAGQDRPRSAAEAAAQAVRVSSLRRSDPDIRDAQSCPHCGSGALRPSVIVDGFGGTGTTALVAKALGRHGISVDLSRDYCRLAEWRTNDPAELAKAARIPKPPVEVDGQADLFADEVTA